MTGPLSYFPIIATTAEMTTKVVPSYRTPKLRARPH